MSLVLSRVRGQNKQNGFGLWLQPVTPGYNQDLQKNVSECSTQTLKRNNTQTHTERETVREIRIAAPSRGQNHAYIRKVIFQELMHPVQHLMMRKWVVHTELVYCDFI